MEIKKEKMEVTLTPQELNYYNTLFTLHKERDSDSISSENVKDLFITSGLQAKDLAAIWNMSAEKHKKNMERADFFTALKLIAIKQNGKLLDDYLTECRAEQPLPKFHNQEEEVKVMSPSIEPMSEKQVDDLIVTIPSTDFVKSGYFGMSSYTIYRVETRSNINGFDPRKTYVVHRRFSDFDWLHNKLQAVEKYKGCVFPPLPSKKMLGKNSQDLVDKRREDLQIYMQILSRHTLIKYDSTLKYFLKCESTEEFEKYKNDPKEFAQSSSMAVNALKDFCIKDTFNYLYSSIKTKLVEEQEPEEIKSELELDNLSSKITKYTEFLNKSIALISSKLAYEKKRLKEQEHLVKAFEDTQDEDPELEKTFRSVSDFYKKEAEVVAFCVEKENKLLSDIKEEKLKQEGIQLALLERKSNIGNYNALADYIKSKQGKGAQRDSIKVEKEVKKVKERISTINENLRMELGSYVKNREESLRKLMGHHCYVEQLKAKKATELAEEGAKEFPVVEFEPSPAPFSFQGEVYEEETKGREELEDLDAEEVQ